jgi:hypothetical protein
MNLEKGPKEGLVSYINLMYEKYQKGYTRYSALHENLWQWTTLVIMILGFIPSLVLAIQGVYKDGGPAYELLKTIPPLIASLLAAVLVIFKVYEKFKLREHGRLYFTDLVTEAIIRLSQCKVDDDYLKLHDYLRKRVTDEQYRQMMIYFGLHQEKPENKQSTA